MSLCSFFLLVQLLGVSGKEYFRDFPRSIRVPSLENAYFFCSAPRGNSIGWSIAGGSGESEVLFRSSPELIHSTYELKNVEGQDDRKIVRCTIRHPANNAALGFAGAILRVLDRDHLPRGYPQIVEDSGTLKAEAGLAANLRCKVKARPPMLIQWLKNGFLLDAETDPNTAATTEPNGEFTYGMLHILRTSEEDSGQYRCMIFTRLGTTVSENIDVSIHSADIAPRFVTIPPSVVQICKLCEVHMTCTAIGNPIPLVHWKTDGKEFETQPEPRQSELVVLGTRNPAVYTCVAESPNHKRDTIEHRVQVVVRE